MSLLELKESFLLKICRKEIEDSAMRLTNLNKVLTVYQHHWSDMPMVHKINKRHGVFVSQGMVENTVTGIPK